MPGSTDLNRDQSAPVPLAFDDAARAGFGADAWPISRKWDAATRQSHLPDAVARPSTADEVAAVLRWASREKRPVVPVAARSGVTGAGVPAAPGQIAIDLTALDRILSFDPETGHVRVEAGVMGGVLEAYLKERGFTLGHYPQSLDISTVGGWVATLSSGTYSAKYGGIERLLRGLDVVLADGTPVRIEAKPRGASGPWLPGLFLGAEGTMGIVTQATLQTRPIPPHQSFRGFAVPSLGTGLDVVRQAFRQHAEPPLIRLYDAAEAVHLYERVGLAQTEPLLIIGQEGNPKVVEAMDAAFGELAAGVGATDLGPGIGEAWASGRYHANWLERGNAPAGSIADSVEVTGAWPELERIYDDVMAGIRPLCADAMAHWSHFYPDGCGMYVIFQIEDEDPARLRARYGQVWDTILDRAGRHGSTISHHHGIGLVRSARLPAALGSAHGLLKRVKAALDPDGILNPGKLGLPVP